MNKKEYIEQKLKEGGYSGEITGFTECTTCGLCCLRNACSCSVADFEEITVESIEKIIDSGKYMITASFELSEERKKFPIKVIPHISAREITSPQNGINITMMHSKCAMLASNGCILAKEERPSQGLLIIPTDEGCKAFMDVPTKEWEPYMHILDQVVIKRTGKRSQEIFENEFADLAYRLKCKVQRSVIYDGDPIEFAEYHAIQVIDQWGYYRAVYGDKLGNAIHSFIDMVNVKPY